MKWVRCPNCGITSEHGGPMRCPWCDHDLPEVAAAGTARPPEFESKARKELSGARGILWGLGGLALLGCMGLLGGGGMGILQRIVACLWILVPTGFLWLIYLGIHRVLTGRPSSHPVAAFIAMVPLTILAFVILILITCSNMRFG